MNPQQKARARQGEGRTGKGEVKHSARAAQGGTREAEVERCYVDALDLAPGATRAFGIGLDQGMAQPLASAIGMAVEDQDRAGSVRHAALSCCEPGAALR